MGRKSANNNDVMPSGVEIHGKSIRIIFTYQRKRCRESLGLPPTKSNIKFAAGKVAAIKHEIKVGTFNYAAHFPDSKNANKSGKAANNIRLNDLLELYKKIKYGEIRSSTARRYENSFKQCILLLGEDRLVSSLMPVDIAKMRSELMATRTASTVNGYLTVFYGFLTFIEENSYNDRNLRSQLKKLKQPNKDPDPITYDEFSRAKSACRFEQHKNIITLMTYSGIRIGELCALAWEDIDLERKVMRIRRAIDDKGKLKTTKTDQEREVDLMPPAVEALRKQRALTYMLSAHNVNVELSDKSLRQESLRFVFLPNVTQASTKNPYLAKITLNKMWRRICRCAGIRYRTIYQLRHTFASWSLTAHGNVAYIAQQMGHKDYSMLVKVYGRWMPSESKSEADKMWSEMERMGHSSNQNAPTMPQEIRKTL